MEQQKFTATNTPLTEEEIARAKAEFLAFRRPQTHIEDFARRKQAAEAAISAGNLVEVELMTESNLSQTVEE